MVKEDPLTVYGMSGFQKVVQSTCIAASHDQPPGWIKVFIHTVRKCNHHDGVSSGNVPDNVHGGDTCD